jgi:hypothetical protein
MTNDIRSLREGIGLKNERLFRCQNKIDFGLLIA